MACLLCARELELILILLAFAHELILVQTLQEKQKSQRSIALIWNRAISIQEVHRMCIEIINAISIEASSQLQMIDRFPKVNNDNIFLLSQINKSKV